jgi:hypothetical protein
MGKRLYSAFVIVLWLTGFCTASAYAADTACDILASKLTPDISSQTANSDRSRFYQQMISDEKFSSLDTARNTTLNVGLSVLSYVDFTLGTTSDDKTWQINWNKFRSATFDFVKLSNQISIVSSNWNPRVIEALLGNCATRDFYGQITSVDFDQAGFTIALHGVGKWQITNIQRTKDDPSFSCSGAEKATESKPDERFNTTSLVCRKDPNLTITLAIQSNQGSAGPLVIYSQADAANRKLLDITTQVGYLKVGISDLNSRIDEINVKMKTTVEALNKQLVQIRDSKPDPKDPNMWVGVNTGGGPGNSYQGAGTPWVDCSPGGFLSKIHFEAMPVGTGNLGITVWCSRLPVLSIPDWK